MIVTWCLCDACGDLSQICALKLCIWSLHMRLVLPVLNHKVYSYILGKKISNLRESLSWEPTLQLCRRLAVFRNFVSFPMFLKPYEILQFVNWEGHHVTQVRT